MSMIDTIKIAEKIISGLHDALDELEAIASDPKLDAEEKLELIIDCIREARETALSS
jgi:hypothetical protein